MEITNTKLKNRIELLDSRLVGVNKNDGRHLVAEEIKDLLSTYSTGTARTYLTAYKQYFKIHKPYYSSMFRLPKSKQKTMDRAKAKRLRVRHDGLLILKESTIDALISRAGYLLENGKYNEMVASLILLTGRRMAEVVKTASMVPVEYCHHSVLFTGQLKTKGVSQSYVIPLLYDRDKVLKALKAVQAHFDAENITVKEVNRKFERSINQAVTAIFGRELYRVSGGLSSHKLRSLYGEVCISRYHTNEKQSEMAFLSDLLGHGGDDIETALSYKNFKISKNG